MTTLLFDCRKTHLAVGESAMILSDGTTKAVIEVKEYRNLETLPKLVKLSAPPAPKSIALLNKTRAQHHEKPVQQGILPLNELCNIKRGRGRPPKEGEVHRVTLWRRRQKEGE